MGNKWKGTFEATIGGTEYTLRPSFDALCEFEELVGCAANVAFDRLQKGEVSGKLIVGAIWAGIKGQELANGSHCPSFRQLGAIISKEGIGTHIAVAIKFMMYALLPDETIEAQENEGDGEKKSPESTGNDSSGT